MSRKNSISEKGWCHGGEEEGEEVQPIETLKIGLVINAHFFMDQMFTKRETESWHKCDDFWLWQLNDENKNISP